MRRMAFFVEGYSEMLFVERLITEVAGAHNIEIEKRRIVGGKNVARKAYIIQAAEEESGAQFYALIYDCGGDHQVKTRLMEEHENLTKAGYEKIVCIRDVRPDFTREEIPKLEMGLKTRVKGALAPVDFILSTMEIEAWFLADHSHFEKIDENITFEKIFAEINFDPRTDDHALSDTPTEDLALCYAIAGKTYKKSSVANTINNLDYTYFYTDMKDRIESIKRLSDHIDLFLEPVKQNV